MLQWLSRVFGAEYQKSESISSLILSLDGMNYALWTKGLMRRLDDADLSQTIIAYKIFEPLVPKLILERVKKGNFSGLDGIIVELHELSHSLAGSGPQEGRANYYFLAMILRRLLNFIEDDCVKDIGAEIWVNLTIKSYFVPDLIRLSPVWKNTKTEGMELIPEYQIESYVINNIMPKEFSSHPFTRRFAGERGLLMH